MNFQLPSYIKEISLPEANGGGGGGGGARIMCALRTSRARIEKSLTAEGEGPESSVADLGGGFRGFKPPPLGLPKKKKKLMCIEKRHHNMSRPTQYVPIALCLRLSLRQ